MTLTSEASNGGVKGRDHAPDRRTMVYASDTDERDGDRGVTRLFGLGALAVFGARRALRPRE